ncbi:hypothetical protein C8Q76DRAFT_632894 [Earliella scabrosa]|nr:hypothetical protein C8Q76DRAFT_632894 [Earliella scabrosa]
MNADWPGSNLHGNFALAGALCGTEELLEHGVTYDVVCRWIRRIHKRWKKLFPELLPIIEHMKMLLPSLHIHAHEELCQLVYALCYAEGFADIYGEGVETPLREFNKAGTSTREMTAGARRDWINSIYNDWNFQKFLGIGMTRLL